MSTEEEIGYKVKDEYFSIFYRHFRMNSMALNLKTKNITTEKITIKTIYVNTSEASCVQWEGKLPPYYEQLDNTASEIKYQKANEYSQMKDRQDPTYHMYENNDQTLQDVIQEMKQINHLESKLPIVLSSKKASNRHFKIGIGILAACCCILVVALISVAVTPSTMTPCAINPCQNSGKLTYIINSSQPSCECRDGYSGNICQVTPCTDIYCDNGGTCLITGNTSICECPAGISGELCQITPCTSSPCKNHGRCDVLESGYNCSCVDWFSGDNCTDYMCDFELDDPQLCVFEQEYFNYLLWRRKSGSIGGVNFGPAEAADGIFYNLLYAGNYPPSFVVRLVTRNIILDSAKCLTFKYYLYGLRLIVYTDTFAIVLFGNTTVNYWRLGIVNVPAETNKIIFEAKFGYAGFYDPYVTIDSVKLSDC